MSNHESIKDGFALQFYEPLRILYCMCLVHRKVGDSPPEYYENLHQY